MPETFFLLLFALFYSTMLGSLSGHYVFSWQYLYGEKWRKTLLRLALSYPLFIGLPAVFFFLIFRSLSCLSKQSTWTYIYILFASLTVFVPYRLYHFIDAKWPSFLYGSPDDRPEGSELKKHSSESPWGHLYAIAALLVIPFIFWLCIR